MSRADRFVQLYNELSQLLKERLGVDRHLPFYNLVAQAARTDPTVRRWESKLRSFGDLRNAIVHDEQYPLEIIAEPSEKAVEEFERIVHMIRTPPRLLPRYQREVVCFHAAEPLSRVLAYMARHDYSQVVLRLCANRLGLLTAEGITRWLEHNVRHDLISLEDAAVVDVLPFEDEETFVVLGGNHTVYDAEDAFVQAIYQKRPRLYAVIVTETGNAAEAPLGIVTPWDLIGLD